MEENHIDIRKERKIEFTLLKHSKSGIIKERIECFVSSNMTLLELLRDKLNLTGAKESCGIGECGSCSIIMNGEVVRSCLILAFEADKSEIMTVEGLSCDGSLHPVQQSFIAEDAVQCGYCTPGFLMATHGLYQKNPNPSEKEILEAMGGHLCRCTGYHSIFKAMVNVNIENRNTEKFSN